MALSGCFVVPRPALDKQPEIGYHIIKDVPQRHKGVRMLDVYFALLVVFILGLLVGFLMRSENRRFEADFGDHEDVEH
jgi:hypothetical protein